MTEKEGKKTKIEVTRESRDAASDPAPVPQESGPRDPLPVEKREEVEADETPLDETEILEGLRRDVAHNRGLFKHPDEMIRLLDEALEDPTESGTVPAEFLKPWVEAEKESSENRDRWVRSVADFENFKKRARQEKTRILKYRNEEFLKDLLPVLDNLERALEHSKESGDSGAFVEGMGMIARMFKEVLEKYGVTEIQALGEPFDPNLHEAVSGTSVPGTAPNIVVQDLEKGYMYQDRLLRPAKVVVSS